MAVKFAGALLLLEATSIFAIAMAKTNCTNSSSSSSSGSGYSWSYSTSCGGGKNNDTHQVPKRIDVKWDNGFNYHVWAAKNSLVFENDTLVFKHSGAYTVYSMPNSQSYFQCNFTTAMLIPNGAGDEFPFVLKAKEYWFDQNYYFACKKHCIPGVRGMKLSVFPMGRW